MRGRAPIRRRSTRQSPAGPRSTSVTCMRKIAIVIASSFALAGCEPPLSNLLLPMEPSRESVRAPRRELTVAEKESISEAVTLELGDSSHREFKWAPLVVRLHDHITDYCGLVSRNDPASAQDVFRQYYAGLNFDRHGKLTHVNAPSVDPINSNGIPTLIDSKCIQDGYNLLP